MSEKFSFDAGNAALSKGLYDTAVKHFERLLDSAQGLNRMIGFYLLAEAHRLSCNFKTALICYEEVLRLPSADIDPGVVEKLQRGARDAIDFCRPNKALYPLNSILTPKMLIIEPANVCNHSCYKCLYPQMKRRKTFLDPEKYDVFLSKWSRRCGAFEEILFTGGGEPLLNNRLKEIILITKKHMPLTRLSIGSNLAVLTEEMAADLIAAGLNNWEVSLDAADKEQHRSLTGKDTFEKVLENLQMLWNALGEGRTGTLEVAAHSAFDEGYATRIEEIEQLVRGRCSLFRNAPYTTLMNRNLHPGLELFEQTINYSAVPAICLELWQNLVVSAEGGVRRCCSDIFDCPDEETFGNVFTQDLEEILRNRKRWEVQQKIVSKDPRGLYLCGRCYALFKHTSPYSFGDKY